jgi:hypothetical protein
MIGLGVGVDYALFIVTRFREALRAGRPGRVGPPGRPDRAPVPGRSLLREAGHLAAPAAPGPGDPPDTMAREAPAAAGRAYLPDWC